MARYRRLNGRTVAAAASLLLFLACVGASTARGDETAAAGAPPLLEQLNRETEKLYRDVGQGLLRVQLPPRGDEGEEESPLTKYKELAPSVRRELEQRRSNRIRNPSRAQGEAMARVGGAPVVTARTATDADARLGPGASVIVVAPPAPPVQADPAFAPDNVGMLLDGQGHLLVPLFIETDAAASHPVRVAVPGGEVVVARFIGSDRQTNLTVVKLPRPKDTPLRLADGPPRDGSLALFVSPGDAAGRLGLWTGGGRDFAVVFSIDGHCAGVTRPGQFLSGRACRLIAEQIVRHGSVRRATLGVIITVVRNDDAGPADGVPRAATAGERTAMRVDQVIPGSAADKAGLRPGDLLLALAGEPVHDIPTLAAAIAARSGPVELQVLRGGEVLKVIVDLQQK